MNYHVRITLQSDRSHDETKCDLSEAELRDRVLTPYELGNPLIINGRTIPPHDIERIRVSQSEGSIEHLIAIVKHEDRNSSVMVLGGPSYEWSAEDKATDVTDQFISGPPGYKKPTDVRPIPVPVGSGAPTDAKSATVGTKVFLVHGQNDAAKEKVARFLEKLKLNAVILHEQPNKGRTIIEKFTDHADVPFAVVLMTADDVGGVKGTPPKKLSPRARQNVVLELGYFLARLGRGHVCALFESGVEMPSDYSGVLYLPLDSGGAWRLQLVKEIKAAGLPVDLNDAV